MTNEAVAPFVRYEYTRYSTRVTQREFVRETEHYLIDARGNRTQKQNTLSSWHESREQVEKMIAARLQREADQKFARLVGENAKELVDALEDLLNGWRYIRQTHGDLYGVGWDRAQEKAESVLSRLRTPQTEGGSV